MEKITRAVTEEQVQNRREEIINSCYKIYLEKGFFNTSIKDISQSLSFARSSIYNYYQTKEEIFLDVLKREYNYLNDDLEKILENEELADNKLSTLLSQAFARRIVLLQMISTSLNELEKNSRIEFLIDFKKSYGKAIENVREIVAKYTSLSNGQVDTFVELFFPFIFGLVSFTIVSERQIEAMEKAGIKWVSRTTEELCYDFLIEMLKGGK